MKTGVAKKIAGFIVLMCVIFLSVSSESFGANFKEKVSFLDNVCKEYVDENKILFLHHEGTPYSQPGINSTGKTILVLTEKRLFDNTVNPSINDSLSTYCKNLSLDGYDVLLATIKIDDGSNFQDGELVLAVRNFLKGFYGNIGSDFTGVILVGRFPNAYIATRFTRSEYDTDKNTTRWIEGMNPPYQRCDIVYADLDGNWDSPGVYIKNTNVYDKNIYSKTGGDFTGKSLVYNVEKSTITVDANKLTYKECFYIHQMNRKYLYDNGKLTVMTWSADKSHLECSAQDKQLKYPLARPEIFIGRIDSRPAVFSIPGGKYENVVDTKGFPIECSKNPMALYDSVTDSYSYNHIFVSNVSDEKERSLLVKYFKLNNSYRKGYYHKTHQNRYKRRLASFGSGGQYKNYFEETNVSPNSLYPFLLKDNANPDGTIGEFLKYINEDSLITSFSNHGTAFNYKPGGSIATMGEYINKYFKDNNSPFYQWHLEDGKYKPGLKNDVQLIAINAESGFVYSLGHLMDKNNTAPKMYIADPCLHSAPNIPGGIASQIEHSYKDEHIGQFGTSMMFLCRGLVYYARSSVSMGFLPIHTDFGDITLSKEKTGFWVLREGGCWGECWKKTFDTFTLDEAVGNEASRKYAYAWTIFGDPTLTLYPQGVSKGIDLEAREISVEKVSVSGSNVMVKVKTSYGNPGVMPLPPGEKLRYRIILSKDKNWNRGDYVLYKTYRKSEFILDGLTADNEHELTIPSKVPNGDYYLGFELDDNNKFEESNEKNNIVWTSKTSYISDKIKDINELQLKPVTEF